MDETIDRKIRDLRLKILKTEKELAATQHSANLGTWLHAGRAGQIQRSAERDKARLEAKLSELKSKLEEIAPGSSSPPSPPKVTAPIPQPVKAAEGKKKAAAKKPAAKKSPGRKSSRS